jgi:hypothetical protein
VKLCNDYGTIPCEAHVKAWGAVGHFINGSFGTPTTIFCDPAGKELFRTEGDPGAGDMAKKMTEALAKVDGEKIPSTTWTQATQLQADAQAAFDKGDVRKAIELWTKIAKLKGNSFRTLALEGYKKAGDKGAEALKAALAIDNVADRKTELRKIVEDYKSLNVSAYAQKELEALK